MNYQEYVKHPMRRQELCLMAAGVVCNLSDHLICHCPASWRKWRPPLAQAGVPIFTLATYNTDYLLVPSARLADACNAIQQAGHVMSD